MAEDKKTAAKKDEEAKHPTPNFLDRNPQFIPACELEEEAKTKQIYVAKNIGAEPDLVDVETFAREQKFIWSDVLYHDPSKAGNLDDQIRLTNYLKVKIPEEALYTITKQTAEMTKKVTLVHLGDVGYGVRAHESIPKSTMLLYSGVFHVETPEEANCRGATTSGYAHAIGDKNKIFATVDATDVRNMAAFILDAPLDVAMLQEEYEFNFPETIHDVALANCQHFGLQIIESKKAQPFPIVYATKEEIKAGQQLLAHYGEHFLKNLNIERVLFSKSTGHPLDPRSYQTKEVIIQLLKENGEVWEQVTGPRYELVKPNMTIKVPQLKICIPPSALAAAISAHARGDRGTFYKIPIASCVPLSAPISSIATIASTALGVSSPIGLGVNPGTELRKAAVNPEVTLDKFRELVEKYRKHLDEVSSSGRYAGFNPLHLALEKRDIEKAKILIKAGSHSEIPFPNGGETPLAFATKNFSHDPELLALLAGKAPTEKRKGGGPCKNGPCNIL